MASVVRDFAEYRGSRWDRGFGAEAMVVRVAEQQALSAFGAAIGGLRLSERDRGRIWLDIFVANRTWTGIPVGAGTGITGDIRGSGPVRVGGHVTAWIFVGVVPFVRIAVSQKSGAYVDFGIKVALPALRF